MVAAGISDEGYTNTSEIIDLKKNSDLWKTESQKYRRTERQIVDLNKNSDLWNDPKQLPTMLDTPLAGYLDESTPLLCGMSILKFLNNYICHGFYFNVLLRIEATNNSSCVLFSKDIIISTSKIVSSVISHYYFSCV